MIRSLPGSLGAALLVLLSIGLGGCNKSSGPPDGGSLCGNGRLDPGEECDGVFPGLTCVDRGYHLGTLVCTSSCTYDESGCELDPCWDYPCAPYGTSIGSVVEDLSFAPGNDASRSFVPEGETYFRLGSLFRRNVRHGGDLKALLLFVATGWCPYCRSEAPRLEPLYQELKAQGILLVGLIAEDNRGNPATGDFAKKYGDQNGWTFPAIAGSLSQDYWTQDDDAGSVPMHLFIDLSNMRIFGRFTGAGEPRIVKLALQQIAQGARWGQNGEREIDFNCAADGGLSEHEPNGLTLGTPENGTTLPFTMTGVVCPPTVAEGLAVDEDAVDLGTLTAGTVLEITMASGTGSSVFPFFYPVRIVSSRQREMGRMAPAFMQTGQVKRQLVVDKDGRYQLVATDGRVVSGLYYSSEETPPEDSTCCTGGPGFTYTLQIAQGTLAATESPLRAGQARRDSLAEGTVKVYPFQASAGVQYTIELKAVNSELMDPYLVLYSPDTSAVLASNDDADSANGVYDSRIVWTSTSAQTVWIIADYFSAAFKGTAPQYDLVVN
jgi:thiol-disulfide isomerase/thioredoxin